MAIILIACLCLVPLLLLLADVGLNLSRTDESHAPYAHKVEAGTRL